MLKLELKLLRQLDTILEREELMWKHKARIDWINFGERNTSFYHSRANGRARKRTIQALKVDDDEWCSDHAYLREVATSFFASLFDVESLSPPVLPLRGQFPSLLIYDLDKLTMISSPTETKDALFDMSPLKAPGIDGLHAHFYQSNWDILGSSVCSFVNSVFVGSLLILRLIALALFLSQRFLI
ncbi:hypothetical protein V6N13_054876 [Hibiscus sabdariffa]